jgi:hypothetical protein
VIYRGPSFLAVVSAPHPTPFPSPVSKLSLFLSPPVCRRSSLLMGERGRGGRGAKLYDREKASPSINQPILSGDSSQISDFLTFLGLPMRVGLEYFSPGKDLFCTKYIIENGNPASRKYMFENGNPASRKYMFEKMETLLPEKNITWPYEHFISGPLSRSFH